MAEICTVLVIEPSDLFREFLDAIVDHVGYDVVAVDMTEAAQQRLEQQRFDIVILASAGGGPRIGPLQLAQRAAATGAQVLIVLDDASHRRMFLKDGYTMLVKPFMPRTLIAELELLRSSGAIDCEPRQPAA